MPPKVTTRYGLLLLALLSALFIGTLFITQSALRLSLTNAQQLAFILSGCGILSSVLAYAIYRSGVLLWIPSLFWTLSLGVTFTVAIILVMLWGVSQVVFISSVYFSIITSVLAFAGASALAFGYFIARGTTERLTELEEGTKAIMQGNLSNRLDVRGADELTRLTVYFNKMAARLEEIDNAQKELDEGRKNLIAWVSHDLRTPLTNIRIMLEAIIDGVVTDESTRQSYITMSLAEIEQLNHLINDLFELTKLEIGMPLAFERVRVQAILAPILKVLGVKAQKKGIRLYQTNETSAAVNAAPDKLARVFQNLLENAISYSPEGAEVRITYHETALYVEISISNTGTTLSEAQLKQLFTPFYRGEESRKQQDSQQRGSGLGLAIAHKLIEAHNGVLSATANAESVTFIVRLRKSTVEN